MTTGDTRNALRRLRSLVRELRIDEMMDDAQLLGGEPRSVLPLLHYLLLRSDLSVAHDVVSAGYNLSAKNDEQFAAGVLRFLAQSWSLSVRLQADQLLTPGFAEIKLLLLCDVAAEVVRRKRAANPGQPSRAHAPRATAAPATASSPSAAPATALPHSARAGRLRTAPAPAVEEDEHVQLGAVVASQQSSDSSALLQGIFGLAAKMDALHALVQREFAAVGERLSGIEHGLGDLRRAWRGAPAVDAPHVSVASMSSRARASDAGSRVEDGAAVPSFGAYDARRYEVGARERADSVRSSHGDHVDALASSWSSEPAAGATVGGGMLPAARVPNAASHATDSLSLRLADDIRAWQQLTTNEFVRAMSSRMQSLSGARGPAQ